jgi:hypothetical protein
MFVEIICGGVANSNTTLAVKPAFSSQNEVEYAPAAMLYASGRSGMWPFIVALCVIHHSLL